MWHLLSFLSPLECFCFGPGFFFWIDEARERREEGEEEKGGEGPEEGRGLKKVTMSSVSTAKQ